MRRPLFHIPQPVRMKHVRMTADIGGASCRQTKQLLTFPSASLRCKSLNSIMREEFYQSQFGEARGQTSANLPGDISQSHSPRCPSKYQVSQPVTAEAQLI